MRSNKQRSRSKPNRNRSVGNVVNRVFESSGPEGKVRGTPQQIIDKYNQLARDAQLSGDRVAMENFQQHAEHYTRMLAEAQREQDERREQQESQQRDRQPQAQDGNRQSQDGNRQNRGDQPDREPPRGGGDQPDVAQPQPYSAPQPAAKPVSDHDVLDLGTESDSGLVETPESKPAPKPRTRRPRKPAVQANPQSEPQSGNEAPGGADTPNAAE